VNLGFVLGYSFATLAVMFPADRLYSWWRKEPSLSLKDWLLVGSAITVVASIIYFWVVA
jgi:hypothetical protein